MLDLLSGGVRKARDTIVQAAARAETFDIAPVLARYQAEEGVDGPTAKRHWRELVRFLMMVGHAGNRGYGMHGPTDKLWHHFVLHTALYQSFCESHVGRFLHHHPAGSQRGTVWRSGYLRFLIDYRTVLGETPPEDVWPLPVVSGVKLPDSSDALRTRHVKAMERFERGVSYRRGVAAVGLDGGVGCGGVGGSGSGHDCGHGGGGCGDGCSGG